MNGWKVTTHDLRPPVQGGEPIWTGATPVDLPRVEMDTSDAQCGPGWNFTRDPETALRIAGLWPTGRPSRLWRVSANGEAIERGDKCRSPVLCIDREATDAEVHAAIEALSKPFGAHAADMAREQILWREALARPCRDEARVEEGLAAALHARGLDWKLRQYATARDAWAAWDAWDAWAAWAAMDAMDAWAAWDAWDAMDARAARAAWAAWAAMDAWAAWDAWDAMDARAARAAMDARAARAAWDARAARDALTVQYAARSQWITHAPDRLTIGIRDAYRAGLAIAVPTGPNVLGWAMDEVTP